MHEVSFFFNSNYTRIAFLVVELIEELYVCALMRTAYLWVINTPFLHLRIYEHAAFYWVMMDSMNFAYTVFISWGMKLFIN